MSVGIEVYTITDTYTGQKVFMGFDVEYRLKTGETVTDASMVITKLGSNAPIAGMLGTVDIAGSTIESLVHGGIPGHTYILILTANTSLGRTLIDKGSFTVK